MIAFIAVRLRIAQAGVRVVGGRTSRRKTIEIDGLSATAVAAALLDTQPLRDA